MWLLLSIQPIRASDNNDMPNKNRGGRKGKKSSFYTGKQKRAYLKEKRKRTKERRTVNGTRGREEEKERRSVYDGLRRADAGDLSSSIFRSFESRTSVQRRVKRGQLEFSSRSSARTGKTFVMGATRMREDASSSLPCFRRPVEAASCESVEELNEMESESFEMYLQLLADMAGGDDADRFVPFERNLEVWRQFWRAVERGQHQPMVPIVVADVRCPLLYIPESLLRVLHSSLSAKGDKGPCIVVVLTKTDLVPPKVTTSWCRYLRKRFSRYVRHVVPFTVVTDSNDVFPFEARVGMRRRRLRDQKMRYRVTTKRRSVHTTRVLEACGVSTRCRRIAGIDSDVDETTSMTHIGIFGLPSAGKSTLMNALAGQKVTSVSATPGHTKYIQSWFIEDEEIDDGDGDDDNEDEPRRHRRLAVLVDSPGLIVPRLRDKVTSSMISDIRPNERSEDITLIFYELYGVVPLAQIREPFSATRFLGERLAIPKRYGFTFPEEEEDGGFYHSPYAMCEAFAKKKQWRTARSRGQFDVHRAGRELIRDCSTGVLLVFFTPPSQDEEESEVSELSTPPTDG